MTLQDKARFAQTFNRLAVAVRLPADEADSAMQRVYWDGLEDLPLEAVEDAARELMTADWFPKLGEWRSVAEKARNTRVIARGLPSPDRGPWRSECSTCDDTGWEPLTCPGDGSCGMRGATCCAANRNAHPYVLPCVCRPTNRTYQRKKAEERQRASGRAKVRHDA